VIGLSKTVLITEKTAVLTPMPTEMTRIATRVNPGVSRARAERSAGRASRSRSMAASDSATRVRAWFAGFQTSDEPPPRQFRRESARTICILFVSEVRLDFFR